MGALLLDLAAMAEVVGRLATRSVSASHVLEEAIFEVTEELGDHGRLAAPIGEVVDEVNACMGYDVVAGPTSLNPNFLNASTPSPTVGTSQRRVRVS